MGSGTIRVNKCGKWDWIFCGNNLCLSHKMAWLINMK